MRKFIVIYHVPTDAMEKISEASDEEKTEGMKAWYAWRDSIGDKLIDFGSPLMGGTRILPDGSSEAGGNEVSGNFQLAI